MPVGPSKKKKKKFTEVSFPRLSDSCLSVDFFFNLFPIAGSSGGWFSNYIHPSSNKSKNGLKPNSTKLGQNIDENDYLFCLYDEN